MLLEYGLDMCVTKLRYVSMAGVDEWWSTSKVAGIVSGVGGQVLAKQNITRQGHDSSKVRHLTLTSTIA